MAEDTDLTRTEPASARRLQEARKGGDVPRSAELTAWTVLLAALGVLAWRAPELLGGLKHLTTVAFQTAAQPLAPAFTEAAVAALWALVPVLAAIFAVALAAPMLLSGWVYAPARTDFSRLHPFGPFARLVSRDALFDGTRALLKIALVAAAVVWAYSANGGWETLGLNASTQWLGDTSAWMQHGLLALAGALALVAALDAGWQWWRYLRRHAMTWQEVLAEAREAEVHPEIRAQMRGRQQQAVQTKNSSATAGSANAGRPPVIDEVIG